MTPARRLTPRVMTRPGFAVANAGAARPFGGAGESRDLFRVDAGQQQHVAAALEAIEAAFGSGRDRHAAVFADGRS